MAAPVKLWIVFGANNAEKLTLESGMPKSVEDLSNGIKRRFEIEGDIRLQYMDHDFDNNFVNLNQINDIQDKSTVKVILLTDASSVSQGCLHQSGEDTSSSSFDTIILSSPDSATARSQWPTEFQIPKFPYDVEMQLQSENPSCQVEFS